jgi:threonine dehydrogenase-like Zn-dependent dehydrogenase
VGHGVRRVKPGEFVLVVGAGPIGLGIAGCKDSWESIDDGH